MTKACILQALILPKLGKTIKLISDQLAIDDYGRALTSNPAQQRTDSGLPFI
jgi:hypothetical protein